MVVVEADTRRGGRGGGEEEWCESERAWVREGFCRVETLRMNGGNRGDSEPGEWRDLKDLPKIDLVSMSVAVDVRRGGWLRR